MFKCLPFRSLYTMPVKVIYMMVITETCHFLDPQVAPVLLIREVNAMGKQKARDPSTVSLLLSLSQGPF